MRMRSQEGSRDFYFGDLAVGVLFGNASHEPGYWTYEPYRGPGHYNLCVSAKAGQHATCYVDENGHRITFVVASIPSPGVLEVVEVTES